MVSHVKTVILENGESVQFPRLTWDDLFALSDQYKAEYLAELVAEAKRDKLTTVQQWQIKQQAIAQGIEIGRILDLCRRPKWTQIILKASLAKSSVPQAKWDETIHAIGNLYQKIELAENIVLDNAEVAKQAPKPDEDGEPEADFTQASPDNPS